MVEALISDQYQFRYTEIRKLSEFLASGTVSRIDLIISVWFILVFVILFIKKVIKKRQWRVMLRDIRFDRLALWMKCPSYRSYSLPLQCFQVVHRDSRTSGSRKDNKWTFDLIFLFIQIPIYTEIKEWIFFHHLLCQLFHFLWRNLFVSDFPKIARSLIYIYPSFCWVRDWISFSFFSAFSRSSLISTRKGTTFRISNLL